MPRVAIASTIGVYGTAPDFSALRSRAYADDGFDMCYVKDCARAIALLQLAPRLSHRTYKVAAGYQPAYDTQSAVADYLAWLRAGHPR